MNSKTEKKKVFFASAKPPRYGLGSWSKPRAFIRRL
ncbi:hypothetical protein BXY66_0568 [Shimia isoporae]|uniref:Uncharacterized protein n=1 Tax=Shimia isoporae TaxID=647720 RepID=A0A4R1NLF9_9RHOB|nr:hypothetical protein BXY66_0568 [Shimia isoporae]